MNGRRSGSEVSRRVGARCLFCCALLVGALCICLSSASHPRPRDENRSSISLYDRDILWREKYIAPTLYRREVANPKVMGSPPYVSEVTRQEEDSDLSSTSARDVTRREKDKTLSAKKEDIIVSHYSSDVLGREDGNSFSLPSHDVKRRREDISLSLTVRNTTSREDITVFSLFPDVLRREDDSSISLTSRDVQRWKEDTTLPLLASDVKGKVSPPDDRSMKNVDAVFGYESNNYNKNEKKTDRVHRKHTREERSLDDDNNKNKEGNHSLHLLFSLDPIPSTRRAKGEIGHSRNKRVDSQNGGDHMLETKTLDAKFTKRKRRRWRKRRWKRKKRTALNSSISSYVDESRPQFSRSHTQQEPPRDPLECFIKSSCAARKRQDYDETLVTRLPCMCDAHCHLYRDCCHDPPAHAHLPPTTLPPPCRPLTPTAKRPYALPRTVFLVDRCPAGTGRLLGERCSGRAPATHLMDIPVFSRTTSIGYANIFCATCHNDTDIFKLDMSISCFGTVNSTTDLENMTYHAGELRWSSHSDPENPEEEKYCLLDVNYPHYLGRWCEPDLVSICKENWPVEQHVRGCSTHNFYVQVRDNVYRNRDCALCNAEPEDEIQCLSIFTLANRSPSQHLPSLTELFEVKGECADDEVWDAVYRRCEQVSCGYLFTLVDEKCVRSNKTAPLNGKPYLNETCFVAEFSQNLSIAFLNQSIYINETQRLYHLGEYEFNDSWIRVCDETDQWTPIMHLISSVLILISLVCLILHMIIFIALPKRRNIPSMNLFSMTISIFMAEFLFLTFFHLRINYVTCVITGILMYYFLCVSFLWMNAMSIDIFRTFYSSTYRAKSRAVFTQYSLYAWLVPLLCVMVAVLVDHMWPEFILAPKFGTEKCWLNNKWGLVAFFTLPSGIIIMANMILYMASVHNIYTQMKSGEMASATIRRNGSSMKYCVPPPKTSSIKLSNTGKRVCSVPDENEISESDSQSYKGRIRDRLSRGLWWSHKKQRVRLFLYCKLALIMGMTWIFAFFSIHTRSIIFEYLFIVFNGLQGTFIFVSFDLKRKVWEELRYKINRPQHHLKAECSGKPHNTTSTIVRTPAEGTYKYRWCSNRRFQGRQTYSPSQSISDIQPSQVKAESEL